MTVTDRCSIRQITALTLSALLSLQAWGAVAHADPPHIEPPWQFGSPQGEQTPAADEAPPPRHEEQLPPPSPAPAEGLTLEELESVALQHNPALARAAADVEAAWGTVCQSGLRPNPTIGYSAAEIGNEGRGGQQGAMFGQEFVTAGKRQLDRRVAEGRLRAAEERLTAWRLRVLSDVRLGFFDVLAAQRRVELAQRLVEVSDQSAAAVEDLFPRDANQIELNTARIQAEEARTVLDKARNRHRAAWRWLAAVLGTDHLPPQRLEGDLAAGLAELDWDEALRRLLVQSPLLGAARAEVQRARWALDRAIVEPIPNFELQTAVQYDTATRFTVAGVQMTWPWPIYNRNRGGIARAHAQVARAEAEVARLELAAKQQLALALEQYHNALQQADRYRHEILPKAQDSLDKVEVGYRQDQLGFLILLNTQQVYFRTNIAYLDAIRAARRAAITIDGLLLAGSLQQEP